MKVELHGQIKVVETMADDRFDSEATRQDSTTIHNSRNIRRKSLFKEGLILATQLIFFLNFIIIIFFTYYIVS